MSAAELAIERLERVEAFLKQLGYEEGNDLVMDDVMSVLDQLSGWCAPEYKLMSVEPG